ncbi:glutathione S-transferase family protein [Bradyrhizobium sediminis]|uniref:Glutathione S-transferase family protein n=1 Tax=Bradyrhizobium sediminis TaxID=2840469 RepID=A0A975NP50_9BRAD|nr:glutathione S-transferase family protein [Bradyrhizobium sediminis]QWG18096.1 glutathione S-transferase family protein [Bradyrhizobium sediminis]
MILYYSPQTRAFPVLWALEEIGSEYELKIINLRQGAQKADDYRRLNPMMKVPTLADGETVVTETGAILLHLVDNPATSNLIPQRGDPRRAACIKWLFFVGSNLEPAMGERFQGWTPNPYYNGWGDFDRVQDVMSAALTQGPWLLGEQFTVADIYLAADLRIARMGDLIAADLAPFADYLHRIESRPAFIRTQELDARVAARSDGA